MIPVAGQYIAELNGVELGYTVIGKGPPLLVVAPGWGIGSLYLQRGLAPLAARFTMIFVDPRGSGRSGRPADDGSMNSAVMAEDIHALTQHLKLAAVDLIAHSNGGAIALAFAANHPEACGKLALVDSQLMGFAAGEATGEILARAKDDPRYRSAVRHLGSPLPRIDDAFTAHLKTLLPLYFHHPRQMLPRFLQTMDGVVSAETFHAHSAADRAAAIIQIEVLGRIRASSLVMVGRHDWICPLEVSKRIHAGLSSSTLEIFEFSGHFPWIEEPLRFFGTLESFLRSTDNDRATARITSSQATWLNRIDTMRNSKFLGLSAVGCMWLLSNLAGHAASAVAEPAPSQYTDVVNALQTTKPVRLLTDLGQCTNESAGTPGPSLQGGLSINTFIVLPGRGLFFSDVHQTLDEENQPVTEYIRYNLTTDDRLRVSLTRIVNSAVAKDDSIVCQISLGARFVW